MDLGGAAGGLHARFKTAVAAPGGGDVGSLLVLFVRTLGLAMLVESEEEEWETYLDRLHG